MNTHLSLESNGRPVALNPDAEISIEELNPLFNTVELKSFPFTLPISLNRNLFKNVDARDSSLRAADIEGMPIRVSLDGIPYRRAVLHVEQNQVIDGQIPVNLDSRTKTFRDLIQDLKCRDVPVHDDIIIGEKIGDIEFGFDFRAKYSIVILLNNQYGSLVPQGIPKDGPTGHRQAIFTPPATGFSYPAKCSNSPSVYPAVAKQKSYADRTIPVPTTIDDYINVSQPYPLAKYCNTRIAYAHYGIDAEGKTSSTILTENDADKNGPEDYSPYWVLSANRSASGVCFYVAYFLERLFSHLGVAFDMSALTAIEDFNYLAFITTQCKYREERIAYSGGGKLSGRDAINQWLSSRGCDGSIDFEQGEIGEKKTVNDCTTADGEHYEVGGIIEYQGLPYKISYIYKWIETSNPTYGAYINRMYATSDNLPDANVSDIISSLEDTFGVRFLYDPETNKVTVHLLRDVFRQQQAPIKLRGKVLTMHKKTEKITGVRVKYSGESDPEEQRNNVRLGVRDYDTDYDYIEYPDGRTQIKHLAQVVQKIDVQDMNAYVDPTTGDAFRIKVDGEASTVNEMRPTAFEVGQFKGIEAGNCSKENEDFIKELSSSFKPVVVNDVNNSAKSGKQPLLVPFIDVKMEHEFVESKARNPFSIEGAEVYLDYIYCGVESFDPTSTDDGSSPLQQQDWGLTLGILRTGDGGAGVENYDPDYDGFGNWRWRDVADNYCVSADTMDATGRWLGKTSRANTFSLKLRAWKPFVYYIDSQGTTHVSADMTLLGQPAPEEGLFWLLPCDDDERNLLGQITKRVRSRGLVDVFLPEYIQFLLSRMPYEVRMLCEVAQLADIPNHWLQRFDIDGKICYINKLSYSMTATAGLSEVKMEVYCI